MRIHLFIAAAAFVGLAASASAEKLSPTQVLSRALAPKISAIQACGIHAGAVAKFGLDFDGRIQNVRFEGLAAENARECVTRELTTVQVPRRLSYIVKEIVLPLPVAPTAR
jgi:hypothetical protein